VHSKDKALLELIQAYFGGAGGMVEQKEKNLSIMFNLPRN
jgi:hypothetical protein